MPGLVVFLHGLGGNRHSWGAVPDFIRNSPFGNDFDVATPEYSASLWSPSTIETSAQQILTFIQTTFPDHDPIFIIGYSLGGLIGREIARHLLLQGPDALLNKIPAVVTVGTPLEGARLGNSVLGQAFFLSKKIRQLASLRYAFDEYRHAIREAARRRVHRPKQFHIQMEDDRVIKRHIESHFTEDDVATDVIPHGHTNFAERNEDASYIAEVLLRQLRKAHVAISRPSIRAPEPVAGTDLPDRLVLIACSRGKREGGESPFAGPPPVGWIPQPGLRQRVISKSSYVYSLLHDAKLADGFERGGNRAHQPANANLKHGPDLGGVSVSGKEGRYLPAWTSL
jgi:pimeloyl-ACP methyl ester carboxylesterase